MIVEVTEDDIRNGNKNSCRSCPIANAINRLIDDSCIVGQYTTRFKGKKRWLPFEAQEFVRRFDANLSVSPFTFTLED